MIRLSELQKGNILAMLMASFLTGEHTEGLYILTCLDTGLIRGVNGQN